MIDKLVLALVVIGALNWGSIGIFQFDLVAALFGGQASMISRIVIPWLHWLVSGRFLSFSGIPKCIMKRQENDGFSKTEKER